MSGRLLTLVFWCCAAPLFAAELVMYLPFDEGSGKVARSASDSPRCAVIHGELGWISGRLGQAVRFAGDAASWARLDVPATWFNENINGLSVLMWAKANSPGRILFGAHAPASSRLYIAVSQGGNWAIGIQDKNWGKGFTGTPLKADKGWHALALTLDNGRAALYVDGRKTIEKSYTPFEISASPVLGSVAPSASGTFSFDGCLDEVAIYKGVLTEAEITEAMTGICSTRLFAQTGSARAGGGPGPAPDSVVASWRLDDGQGDTARDSTPNSLHGAIRHADWCDGLVGFGLRFRGENGIQVTKHAALDKVKALTIEWWMNWDPRGAKFPTFFAMGERLVLYGYRYSQRLCIKLNTDTAGMETATARLPVYTWSHIVVTWDGANGKVVAYVDGEKAWSGTLEGAILPATDAAFTVGRAGKSKKHRLGSMSGDIDEIMVHRVALGPEVVVQRHARLAALATEKARHRWFPVAHRNEKLEPRTTLSADGKLMTYPDFPIPDRVEGSRKIANAADFPSIQAAVDSLPKMGGMVIVPTGVWEIESPIVLRSAVTLAGTGESAIIVNRNTEGKNAVEARENTGYRPKDRFPPGARGNYGIVIKNLQVRGNPKSGHGICLYQADHIDIENVETFFNGKTGVYLSYGEENCVVRGLISKWNGEHGFYIEGCHDTLITSSHFEENMLDGCHVQKDNIQANFTACNVEDNGRFGIYNKGRWTQVVGCQADSNEGGAFVYIGPEAEYSTTISGNVGGTVKAVNAHHVAITGNHGGTMLSGCRDCTVSGNTGGAIALSDGSFRIAVTGNSVPGITVGSACHDNVIAGNVSRSEIVDRGKNNIVRNNVSPAPAKRDRDGAK